jgi:hypothetical protein
MKKIEIIRKTPTKNCGGFCGEVSKGFLLFISP